MKNKQYIYNLNYKICENELCAIELRSLFDFDSQEKVFFSDKEVDPSISPFLKSRLEVIYKEQSFEQIIDLIKRDKLDASEFVVNYLELTADDPYIKRGREFSKAIGLLMIGFPSYKRPKIRFGITNYEDNWYFGILVKNNFDWRKHNLRPYSYSSSLGINIAKVLINVAGKGNLSKKIIDPCCGVGTVLFEGFFAGYNIVGGEKNSKVASNARENLIYFNYPPNVITGDIKDIEDEFDVSIVDLPYGISSHSSLEYQSAIIKNAKRISKKIVLVSCSNIENELLKLELKIIDSCTVHKTEKREFARYIWVCE